MLRILACTTMLAITAGACFMQNGIAHGEDLDVLAAVNYCRKYRGDILLSEDKSLFCFDGPILANPKLAQFFEMNDGGTFVIRSGGGEVFTAIEIANVLKEKKIRVVTYDLCISACAGYIFVASDETYVAERTIVAWHLPLYSISECENWNQSLTKKGALTTDTNVMKCGLRLLREDFFAKRNINGAYTNTPMSAFTKKTIKIAVEGSGDYRNILWMWNPRYYRNYFPKNKIDYHLYPQSQIEVDNIAKRFGLPDIIYDP